VKNDRGAVQSCCLSRNARGGGQHRACALFLMDKQHEARVVDKRGGSTSTKVPQLFAVSFETYFRVPWKVCFIHTRCLLDATREKVFWHAVCWLVNIIRGDSGSCGRNLKRLRLYTRALSIHEVHSATDGRVARTTATREKAVEAVVFGGVSPWSLKAGLK